MDDPGIDGVHRFLPESNRGDDRVITPDIDQIYTIFLVFTRATGMFFLMPVFSGQMIPRQVRIAIAMLLAVAIAPAALGNFHYPDNILACLIQIAHELCVGTILGLVARMIFYALELAGEYISVSIGLSLSPNIDPFTRGRASPPNTILVSLATVLFLVTDSHQWCFLAFVKSFEIAPPDAALHAQTMKALILATQALFVTALQIVAPIMAISFVVNLTFAALGRAAPSLNVFQLSFAVQILAGLFLFGATMTLTAQYIIGAFRAMPMQMLESILP